MFLLLTHGEHHVLLSQGGAIVIFFLIVLVDSNQSLHVERRLRSAAGSYVCPALHFELGSFTHSTHTHTHTRTHYVSFANFLLRREPHSCKCKDPVHRDLCRSSQNSMHCHFFLLFILHSWPRGGWRRAAAELPSHRRTFAAPRPTGLFFF